MNFDNIIGQAQIIKVLKNSIECDKVGHAYVFNGPKGIGKKTIAKVFAELLLCENGSSEESCGQCYSCRMLENGSNPDFVIVGQNNDSIGVDEIRKMQSDIIIRPMYSKRKVYLIADGDLMTVQAQNCLLKILEEPPKYAVIIITVSNFDALLETIRSRTLKYNFRKNTFKDVKDIVVKSLGTDSKAADFIAAYSDGVIGTALDLSASEEFMGIREKTFDILLKLLKAKLLDVFDVHGFFEANKDNIDTIMDIMLLFYRDMLIAKKTGREKILINSDKKDIILNSAGALSTHALNKNIEIIESTRKNIKQNANYQLAIEVMLMKLQEEKG